MNTLYQTKMLVTGHRRIIKQYYCLKLFNANYASSAVADFNIHRRKTKFTQVVTQPNFSHVSFINVTCVPVRNFYINPTWRGQEPSSKVEETVKKIKEQKDVTQSSEKAIVEKRTLWDKTKAEILHYYHGFRLLFLDMKVSAKLVWRILQGKELSRREHRLLVKTTGDLFRLIPFSVFIIVPFMEFLLPFAIKLFPGLLPSTFQTATEKEDKLKQALKIKIEMAKFLQKTLDDMAVQSSDHKSEKAKEFAEFFYKVRTTGTVASNEEIMKFSKLFEDEITLDSLSRPQLVALCRVLDVQTLGTTNFLRFLLRMRLRSLSADDKLIEKEGVNSLTRSELQQACRARAMRAYGMPESKLRDQLSQWLDLSLNEKVPPSLLLLSRALMVPDTIPMSDKLKATISALPDTVVARTKGAIGEKEGKIDHKTNIEIIKLEEKRIEEEREEQKQSQPPPVTRMQDSKEDEITTTDVKVIEQALDSIDKAKKTLNVEKEEIKDLKEEMAEYQEDVQELNQIKAAAVGQADIEDIKVSKGAKRLFNKVNKMIGKMDAVLHELEQSEKQVKKKIETLNTEEKPHEEAVEQLVKIEELIAAIKKIQSVPDQHRLTRITEILRKIDDDRDGAIKIEDVLKVVELIGKEDVKLSKIQLDELLELMDKEEILEVEDQLQKLIGRDMKCPEDGTQTSIYPNDKSKTCQKETKNPVPATPVTKEKPYGEEELKEDIPEPEQSFSEATIKQSRDKSAAVLQPKSKSDQVGNPPLTPGVSSTATKAEGSKHL